MSTRVKFRIERVTCTDQMKAPAVRTIQPVETQVIYAFPSIGNQAQRAVQDCYRKERCGQPDQLSKPDRHPTRPSEEAVLRR